MSHPQEGCAILVNFADSLEKTDTDVEEAIASMLSITSLGITTLTMLETLLPTAAKEVEHDSNNLSQNFTVLFKHIWSQESVPPEVRAAIDGITMGMQFQDRNSQIMENAASMLERYRIMLEDIRGNLVAMRHGHTLNGHNIATMVENIFSFIRLSDIRNRYLVALKKAKMYHDNTSDELQPAPGPSENIELF